MVTSAESIKKSDKLLKIEVDLGSEKRTIVSGIRKFYDPEQLLGRKVVVVVNLKPAKLMGIESQGMLLCGSAENALELLTVDSLPVGSRVS